MIFQKMIFFGFCNLCQNGKGTMVHFFSRSPSKKYETLTCGVCAMYVPFYTLFSFLYHVVGFAIIQPTTLDFFEIKRTQGQLLNNSYN